MDIRRVTEPELLAASRLTFAGLPASQRAARRFIAAAPANLGIDFSRQIVALQNDLVCGACLYVLTPGRGATVLSPALAGGLDDQSTRAARRLMIAQAAADCREAGALLIQTLLEESPDKPDARDFLESRFEFLALLEYLELPIAAASSAAASDPSGPRPGPRRGPVPGWPHETWRPELDAQFAALLEQTYRQSRDCPALDGLRQAADVLAGHRATGTFTPQGWTIAYCQGVAAGLVLVNRMLGRQACELVYMGVAAEYRRRGLGDWLLERAIETTRRLGLPVLSLAVDANNEPAKALYLKAGFKKTAERYAYHLPPARR